MEVTFFWGSFTVATVTKSHNGKMLQLQKDWRLLLQGELEIIWGTQPTQGQDRNGWGAPFKNHPFSTRKTWGVKNLTFLLSSCNGDLIEQVTSTSLDLKLFTCTMEMKSLTRVWIMDVQMLCEFHSDVPRGITVAVIIIMAIIIIIVKSAEGLLHKLNFFLSIRYQRQRVLLYWTRTLSQNYWRELGPQPSCPSWCKSLHGFPSA